MLRRTISKGDHYPLGKRVRARLVVRYSGNYFSFYRESGLSWTEKMAKVQVTNVTVLDNPTAFVNPFQFEITFECLEDLPTGEAGSDLGNFQL